VTGVVVLGSTGSIGRQTLDVVRRLRSRFRVVGLAAGENHTLLEDQVREFRPALVWCANERRHMELKAASGRPDTRWVPMEEMASHPDADVVVVATSGVAGLEPTLAALRAGKAVALANKEVLVMAGGIVTQTAAEHGGQLRPVDSEHSAIWQCLWGEDLTTVERLILTASGGAFRDRPLNELDRVTPAEALRHPTWQMGRKITVDSATLLNKGLEAIEARWLFDVPLERIEVVMHRESIVHSLVEFRDGSVKAQMGEPDMRLPIQIALTYPERMALDATPRLDLAKLGTLHFAPPDFKRYPCLQLALQAGRAGGTAPAALVAADEVAVDAFLRGDIAFTAIARVISDTLERHTNVAHPSLVQIQEAAAAAREEAARQVVRRSRGAPVPTRERGRG
jgi:1-deoxy-D-xylulose-5-phosphate reductoisomerase